MLGNKKLKLNTKCYDREFVLIYRYLESLMLFIGDEVIALDNHSPVSAFIYKLSPYFDLSLKSHSLS